jgi:integrase
MGHIVKTPAGTFRANWRDVTDRQKAKTFRTRKQAAAFLAEVESALRKGSYVDPRAGRVRFGDYAARWLSARDVQRTTRARDESLMRNHVLAHWSAVPIGRIDHLAVQQWVAQLASKLSPATVDKCHNLLSLVLAAAVRDRLIGVNPADGVRLPATRKKDTDDQVVTPDVLAGKILPAIPDRYRALVAFAGGTGLRWGECVGLRWDAVDLDTNCVRVIRVAVEVAGTVTAKPFPKSRAGRRTVPLPAVVVELLTRHRDTYPPGPAGEVFTNSAGGPLRRTLFRSRVCRPALVAAGLLGSVKQLGDTKYRATWKDNNGPRGHSRSPDARDGRERRGEICRRRTAIP